MFAIQPSLEKTLFESLIQSNSLTAEKQKICWEALKKAKLLQCERRSDRKKKRSELCSKYMQEFSKKNDLTAEQKNVVEEFVAKVRTYVSKKEHTDEKELPDKLFLEHLEEKCQTLTLKQKQAVSSVWTELRSFLSDGYLYTDLKIFGIFSESLKRAHFTEKEQDALFSALNDVVYVNQDQKSAFSNFFKKLRQGKSKEK